MDREQGHHALDPVVALPDPSPASRTEPCFVLPLQKNKHSGDGGGRDGGGGDGGADFVEDTS
jgi:hypothetical protein